MKISPFRSLAIGSIALITELINPSVVEAIRLNPPPTDEFFRRVINPNDCTVVYRNTSEEPLREGISGIVGDLEKCLGIAREVDQGNIQHRQRHPNIKAPFNFGIKYRHPNGKEQVIFIDPTQGIPPNNQPFLMPEPSSNEGM